MRFKLARLVLLSGAMANMVLAVARPAYACTGTMPTFEEAVARSTLKPSV